MMKLILICAVVLVIVAALAGCAHKPAHGYMSPECQQVQTNEGPRWMCPEMWEIH